MKKIIKLEYTLVFTDKEIELLKALAQNPHPDLNDEVYEFAEELFKGLSNGQ